MPRPLRLAIALSSLAAAFAPLPIAHAATSPEQATAALNAQRAANGIPGDLTMNPGLNDGCAKHVNYLALNGGGLEHGEDPAKPGYTAEGANRTPGSSGSEVLSSGATTWDDRWVNPWADAPIHLLLMFAPTVATTGYAENGPLACQRFTGRAARGAGIYTLPGNGATGVPPSSDSSSEGPYSPADAAGVPDDTGYNLLLWRVGGTTDIAAASLTSAAGPADVRIVDTRTPVPGGGTFNWGGSAIVPAKALEPDTAYTANVTMADGLPYSWTFTTAPRDPQLAVDLTSNAGRVELVPQSLAPIDPARITVSGPPGSGPISLKNLGETYSSQVRVPGTYRGCVTVGGPGTGWSLATVCKDLSNVRAPQTVSIKAAKGGKVRVTASATGAVRRDARIIFTNSRGRVVGKRTFRLVDRTLSRPKGARRYRLTAPSKGGYLAVAMAARL